MKNIVSNFLVVGFEPKLDFINLLLVAATCVNVVVIGAIRNIIPDWLTQLRPYRSHFDTVLLFRHAAHQLVNVFRQSNFTRQLELQPNKCSHFGNCKHSCFLCMHLSSAKKGQSKPNGWKTGFFESVYPIFFEIKLEHTTPTKQKADEVQSFLQDPKFRSSLASILVETGE